MATLALLDARDIPLSRRAISLIFLLAGYFFYAWSWNTVDILRPYIRDSLALSLTQSGSLYTVQSIGAIAGAIIMGQVADKMGRRNALVISMLGYGSGLLAGLAVASYWQLVGQRIYLGFFMGSMFPIAVGIYSGLFARETRGMIAGFVMGTYNLAVSALGFLSAAIFRAGYDWTILLWAGLAPVLLAPFAFALIPDDRRLIPADGNADGQTTAQSKLPITELFRPGSVWRTVRLAAMTGLNFFAYQAFTGWATTYLKNERKIADGVIGDVLGWQFIGAAAGGLIWGWVGDRFGRRSAAIGFLIAAAIIPVYLFVAMPVELLKVTGALYGIALSASVVWGPWLSELYPPHLRSTAASIFNWGRIVSMTAPLITAPLAESFGLAAVMSLASISFVLAAMIWFSLPETMRR